MLVITERLIQYLKTDSQLVLLLGGEFIESIAIQDNNSTNARILISTNAGQDQNYAPIDTGIVDIIISINRSLEQAATKCYTIAKRIDVLLNRAELSLSNTTYKILNFVRTDSSGLQVADYQQEMFYSLSYSYIIENDK